MQNKGVAHLNLPLKGGHGGRRQGPAVTRLPKAQEKRSFSARRGSRRALFASGLERKVHPRSSSRFAEQRWSLAGARRREVLASGDAGRREDQVRVTAARTVSGFYTREGENAATCTLCLEQAVLQHSIKLFVPSLTDHVKQPIVGWLGLLQAERKYRFGVSHAAEGTEACSSVRS